MTMVVPENDISIEDSIDDSKTVHCYKDAMPLCGAPHIHHPCWNRGRWWPTFQQCVRNNNRCPGCGKPVCSFCQLLLEGEKK